MRRLPKKNKVSIIETIPYELVCEVLGRVAASSLTDIINVKLSSKKLKEIAEDKYVYQHVSLDKFPIVPWKRVNEEQEIFLNKCRESGNPEMMYRLALIDYFNKTNLRSTYQNLERAVKLGHVGALYVTCIVFLLSGDEELKQKGIEYIGSMKKSTSLKSKLRMCRNNLVNQLNQMWVKNPVLKERPRCCSTRHHRKNQWPDEEEEDKCEACCADREINFIYGTYNY